MLCCCDKHRPVEGLICDRCAEEFDWEPYPVDDNYGFHWEDPTDSDVEFQAEQAGWKVTSEEVLCPDCYAKEEEE